VQKKSNSLVIFVHRVSHARNGNTANRHILV